MLSPSTNEHALLESDTSADELYQDVSTGVYPPHKRQKGAPVKRHLKPDQESCFELSSSKADYRVWQERLLLTDRIDAHL
jgi:hypothetical protein